MTYTIDVSAFPLVWLPAQYQPLDEDQSQAFIAGLGALLDAGRRYVLIAENGPPPMSEAGSQAFSRWFRRERDRLRQVCAGMVMLIADPQARAVAEGQVAAMLRGGAWPYPMIVLGTRQDAEDWAAGQLALVQG
ncbi:hypothetical protein [Insolitispirillum peregrinum]|uniref:SpoIIAA-like n=1 Tax=Insolitispirillum peregrinum TaxID=80876 RepID=A0A1N7P9X9_9PROT|nr:hypothetical protein [Insolitispirillum peregrinum]SIT07249.1 hypothetical protein SAMN05421779_106167 [Insolitispirillum peregrinum]